MTKNSFDDGASPNDQMSTTQHMHCDGRQKKKKQAKDNKNNANAKTLDGKHEQNYFTEEEEESKDAFMAKIKNYTPKMTYYTKQAQNGQSKTVTKGRTSKSHKTNKWAHDNDDMGILEENCNIEMTDATNSLIKTKNNAIQPKTSPEQMEHKKASNMAQKIIQ
eukprot:475973-Ditylum_brightwellii.AAC.1